MISPVLLGVALGTASLAWAAEPEPLTLIVRSERT